MGGRQKFLRCNRTGGLIKYLLCTFFLALAGCGDETPSPVAAQPLQVRIAKVGTELQPDGLIASGTVVWRRETPLGFTSAGKIKQINVSEGDTVRAGQVLARLDSTTVDSSLASAIAERNRAKAEYDRSNRLYGQGWVTRSRVESARAAMLVADANLRAANFQQNNAVITAETSGIVLVRTSEQGQVVAPGVPVLTLGVIGEGLVVRIPLSEADMRRVVVGSVATISLSGGDKAVGRVIEVPGRADPRTGTFNIEVSIPIKAARAGDVVEVKFLSAPVAGALQIAVPPNAVFGARAGEGFVYVVRPDMRSVRLRKVELAEATDNAVRVKGGLMPGEWIAVSRIDKLTDGEAIMPLIQR